MLCFKVRSSIMHQIYCQSSFDLISLNSALSLGPWFFKKFVEIWRIVWEIFHAKKYFTYSEKFDEILQQTQRGTITNTFSQCRAFVVSTLPTHWKWKFCRRQLTKRSTNFVTASQNWNVPKCLTKSLQRGVNFISANILGFLGKLPFADNRCIS